MRPLLLLLIVVAASPCAAQIIEPPPRSSSGLFGGRRLADPNRTSQELTLTMNLLAGNDSAVEQDAASTSPEQNGYTGTAATRLRYWRGRPSRFFEAHGRAYVNSYSNLGIDELFGGDVDIQAMTSLGTRTRLTVNLGTHYQPTLLFGAFGAGDVPVQPGTGPDYSTTQGVAQQRWLMTAGSGILERDWSARHQSSFDYVMQQMRPIGETGLDSETQAASLGHSWNASRNVSVNFAYRHVDQVTNDESGQAQPLQSQTADAALTIRKRWSATRRLEIRGGGGATRASWIPIGNRTFVSLAPVFFGGVNVDLARTWAIATSVRREVSVLNGLAPEAFVADSASLSAGGAIAPRLELTVNGAFSRGSSHGGERGSFEAVTGALQLQWNVSRLAAIMTSYNYYNHLLRDITALPPGFPPRFDRSSVRVGLTLWLPFYGSFQNN